jgi:peptide/nickel transport system substrate-binding protein
MRSSKPHVIGLLLGVAFGLIASTAVGAAGSDEGSNGWPRAWYAPPAVASQAGVGDFASSPFLANKGLPPVGKRLPLDPILVTPLNGPGRYGGNARIVTLDFNAFNAPESLLSISADMRTLLPNLAETYSVSRDGRVVSIRLRPGIRWSDGVPLTSDDFVFTFEDLWLDPEYSPVRSRMVRGGRAVKVDELNFRYEFEEPNPLFANVLAQLGDFFVVAKHYYRQFHPKYVDREALNKRLEEMGYINWTSFVSACRGRRVEESVDAPTLRAFKIVAHSPIRLRLERNPYYFKVDERGQQLPYIDSVDVESISNNEVVAAMAGTGQLDFVGTALRTQDFPLLKLAERSGTVQVREWQRLHGSDVVIQPNYNTTDPRLRELFWDFRFRRALSVAIDREEMNEIIYFGRGVPRQVTVHPDSSYFEPAFATAHTQYAPDTAKSLLDEIGLRDADGDGMRDFADGEPLTITLEFFDFETPKPINLELVANYWRKVGIDLRLRLVDGNLQRERAVAGEMQMTVWHGDRVTDVLFPVQPNWWVPRSIGWELSMWNDFARWYMTDGELGAEPPGDVRQLQIWMDRMQETTDDAERIQYGKAILRSTAENLWTLGTVGLAPHPIVVSNRLKNVPREATWGWDIRDTLAYHPSSWYLAD